MWLELQTVSKKWQTKTHCHWLVWKLQLLDYLEHTHSLGWVVTAPKHQTDHNLWLSPAEREANLIHWCNASSWTHMRIDGIYVLSLYLTSTPRRNLLSWLMYCIILCSTSGSVCVSCYNGFLKAVGAWDSWTSAQPVVRNTDTLWHTALRRYPTFNSGCKSRGEIVVFYQMKNTYKYWAVLAKRSPTFFCTKEWSAAISCYCGPVIRRQRWRIITFSK